MMKADLNAGLRAAPILAAILFTLFPAALRAQGIGFAGGAALDPSQVCVGTQFESPPLASHVHFRPGIDGSFGNGVSDAIVDVLFLYKFPLSNVSPWSLYQGTGPVVTIERSNDQLHAHGGLGAVFGLANTNGFFFEFKVSGGGGPNLRLGVGYMIRRPQP
jgi:hypothetical protein